MWRKIPWLRTEPAEKGGKRLKKKREKVAKKQCVKFFFLLYSTDSTIISNCEIRGKVEQSIVDRGWKSEVPQGSI